MKVTAEDQRRLTELFRELADVAVVSESPPTPSAAVVELRQVTHARTERRRARSVVAAAAAVVVLLMIGLGVLARRRDSTTVADQYAPVVVGRVDDFPVGSVTSFPQFGLFIVNDEREGLLALATASPATPADCDGVIKLSDYDRRDYGHSVVPIPANAFFIDTCSSLSFDRVGEVVHGPPPSRGMFRFDTIVENGWISVSTDLMHPAERLSSVETDDPVIVRRGITDRRAVDIEETIQRIAATIADDEILGSSVIVLGAFHDPTLGTVSVPLLMDDAVAELTIPDTGSGAATTVSITWLGQGHGHAVARAGTASGIEVVFEVFPAFDPAQPDEVRIERLLGLFVGALP